MKNLNKLLVKIFSVMLSVMLLNVSAFASGRYATIGYDYNYPYVGYNGEVHNFLMLQHYHEDTGNGGVFFIENTWTALHTQYGYFYDNSAKLNGGVIAIVNYTQEPYIVKDSLFSSNSAANGGAVFISTGTMEIHTSSEATTGFYGNNSTGNGGAIYNDGRLTIYCDENIYFKHNHADSAGGAIYNNGNGIIDIRDFAVFSTNTATYYGGAIYNARNGTVHTGNYTSFVYNSTEINTGMGGAVYNAGNASIGNLSSFQENTSGFYGGAIYNMENGSLTIGKFVSFDNNKASNSQGQGYGGAIYSRGWTNIGEYSSFTKNSANRDGGAINNYQGSLMMDNNITFSSNTAHRGGAIYTYRDKNYTRIGNNSKFLNNKATDGSGGAIYNHDSDMIITYGALFDGNYGSNGGGAIYNDSGNVEVHESAIFKNNTADGDGGAICSAAGTGKNFSLKNNVSFMKNSAGDYGGAICIKGGDFVIDTTVKFSSNTATVGSGGAIANIAGSVTIGRSANFYGNVAKEQGGAIYNTNTAGTINIGYLANFTKNSANLRGGAIYISTGSVTLGNNAEFNQNSANGDGGAVCNAGSFSTAKYAKFNKNSAGGNGGAIFNEKGTVSFELSTQFNNNSSANDGGAINNHSLQSIITGQNSITFTSNTAAGFGGAIYNKGDISLGIGSLFNGNKSTQKSGGAIYNLGDITLDFGTEFNQNSAKGDAGAVYNVDSFSAGSNTRFNKNSSDDYGGAIYNIGDMTFGKNTEFNQNSSNGDGGAIYNDEGNLTIGDYSVFSSNKSTNGDAGAIYNNNGNVTIGDNAQFTNNSSKNGSGAIKNNRLGTITIGSNAEIAGNTSTYGGAIENSGTITFTDGAIFRNNTSASSGSGAILNSGTLNLIANKKDVIFTGNSIAIYNQKSILNLWSNENVSFIFNDRITSNNSSNTLNINQSSGTLPTNGTIRLNADMSGYKGTVNFYNGTIELGRNGTWFGGDLTVSNSPTINMANDVIAEHNFNSLTVNNKLNLVVDADLANAEMDTISATSFGNDTGKIKVSGINILSDIDENEMIEIAFADEVLKEKVESVNKASSALYNYKVKYDKNTGYFRFINGALTKNMGTAATAISATAGGAATQSLVANQVFANMNGKTSNNKKASTDPSNLYVSAGDQVFDNSGKVERGLWLKPFMAQETVKIGDADVDNNLYGTLAGIDFPLGQDKQVSFYLGYAGSKQEVEEVKSNQTGYVLGATGMIIKDSWYAGLTANVMFNKASIDTDFGTDDVDMNMFSFAAKAGYNYNITNSFILEPNLTLVYGVVNSQEYESAQGAQIDSQSISNILLEPQVKAKFEIGNGWQPYGLLGYSANLGSKPTVRTDGVELELDSIDGYVEYGAGVNKDFIDTAWSCYAQVTGRSGGRNGFAGNLGVKYKF